MLCDFIDKHMILKIGGQYSSDSSAELILDEPYKFVEIVLQSGYYISAINWYEYAKIHLGSKLGFGGPRDPRFPEEYFFSETSIGKTFNEATGIDEYFAYMKKMQSHDFSISLVPSFLIRKTNGGTD